MADALKETLSPRSWGVPMAMVLAVLSGVGMGGAPMAAAQTSAGLRGAFDEDGLARIGTVAGAARGRPARPSAAVAPRRVPPGITQRRTVAPPLPTSRGDEELATRPRPPPREVARPPTQDFRSLEPRVNTAVPRGTGRPPAAPGLPPLPVAARPRAAPDADPYAPLGLRLGSLILRPTLDVQAGHDDNATRVGRGQRRQASAVLRTEAGVQLESDWSRHALSGEWRGSLLRFRDVRDQDRPEASGRLGLRLDLDRDRAVDLEINGRLDSERPGGGNLPGTVVGRPLTLQLGAAAGYTQRFGRLALGLRGTVDRFTFEDARLDNGLTLSQRDRALTAYGLRLRTGYEITPGLVPFAEVTVDTRRRDIAVDQAGFRRSSDGVAARVGSTFELTRTLTGELAAGYGLRRFDDPRLRELRGPLADAALTWRLSPLTTLRLQGALLFEESTTPGAPGSRVQQATLALNHAFLRQLTGTASISLRRSEQEGVPRRDETVGAQLGLTYSLGRNMALRASFAHERTRSSEPGQSFSANVWLFGGQLRF